VSDESTAVLQGQLERAVTGDAEARRRLLELTRDRLMRHASQRRLSAEEEANWMDTYGIKDASCDDLPRGVLIGTVELYKCIGEDWHLRKPKRAKKLLKPKKQPQPVWFHPF
jgi:hypothetical protein